MKLSVISLASVLGIAAGFSAGSSYTTNTMTSASSSSSSSLQMSTVAEAVPFAKGPR
jgi:hypothetical protein